MSKEQRTEDAVRRAAATVLGCSPQGMLAGVYRGHPVEVRCSWNNADQNNSGVGVRLHVNGNLHGATVDIVQRAGNYGPAPANTRFDPRLAVGGIPLGVLVAWLDASVQEACVRMRLFVHGRRNVLEISLDEEKAGDPAYLAAACDLGADLIERLPHAIRAAGEERYLALGSLATHPEVIAAEVERRKSARKSLLYIGLTIAICVAMVYVMIRFVF